MTIEIDPVRVQHDAAVLEPHHDYADDMGTRLRAVASFCDVSGSNDAADFADTYRDLVPDWVSCLRTAAVAADSADTDPAALAALKRLDVAVADVPPLSWEAMRAMEVVTATGDGVPVEGDELFPDLLADTGAVDVSSGSFFDSSDPDRIAPEDAGAYDMSDINQGGLGDCWVLGVLGSKADDAEEIEKLVTYNNDGTATVHLAAGDVEVPLHVVSASNGKNAPWVRAIEWAYAQTKGGYDALVGGDPAVAYEEIFGQSTTSVHPVNNGSALGAHDRVESDAVDELARALDGERDATINIDGPHLFNGHILNVVEVSGSPPHRTIKVRNPHGQNNFTSAERVSADIQVEGKHDEYIVIPEARFADLVLTMTITDVDAEVGARRG